MMKNTMRLLTLGLLLGSGFFVMQSFLPNALPNLIDIFAQAIDPIRLDNSYAIDIERDALADSPEMKITNNSDIKLRLHMFNASDTVKLVARANFVLAPGESKSYERGDYVFHVWKSQLFDASLQWTEPLGTDVEFLGNEDNLQVRGSDLPPVTLINNADKQLKFCTYNSGDKIQAIPLDCWTLSPGTRTDWKGAPDAFIFKAFEPALLDDPVLTQSNVENMSAITISKKGIPSFWQRLRSR